ncbi:glutathione S-transferase [Rhodanobacter sp. ANJX3]|uniref:glutathione S-transferase family protein n=1 Tax=Rhodanobacter sp. ANJX3 TaxID=2723083 RepID=UPI001617058A|nr:glutathione S-transferase family protein [Rhodanobacter sp. ANJX3]MBB5359881.1 glutathione S-transferase [Rhodanobacter sp. ANJX3]
MSSLTLFDYLPSRNAWKVRLLLHHLGREHRTVTVDIFKGEGRHPEYLRINPTGKVPAIQLADGRALAESNAILVYLAEGSPYMPTSAFDRAKVLQWLSFEQEQIESKIGALRYWMHAGEWSNQSPPLIQNMRQTAQRALEVVDDQLRKRRFIASDDYTIADMALFAYSTCAESVGVPLKCYPHFSAWIRRVEAQPGFIAAPA